MNEHERWDHLVALDEELLVGGVILSEWCCFIVRESDIAFVHGAHLGAILTALSGIETYLRAETKSKNKLCNLIDELILPEGLAEDIHRLRKYRNKWVHVDDPWNESINEFPERYEKGLEEMAHFAVRVLRRTIYENQMI